MRAWRFWPILVLVCFAALLGAEPAMARGQQGSAPPQEMPPEEIVPSVDPLSIRDSEFEDLNPRPKWNASLLPGYGLLYVRDEKKARQGFSANALLSYVIKDTWSLELRGVLGLYRGYGRNETRRNDPGVFSQAGLSFGARYTFAGIRPWFEPYTYFSVGWLRTELDRQVDTMFVDHSMSLTPGAGVSFRVSPMIWLGTETSLTPVLFGKKAINGSLAFSWLATLEFRL